MTTTTITWTPVAERLPKAGVYVLLAMKDGAVAVGTRDSGAFYDGPSPMWLVIGRLMDPAVTHWADLPAAPASSA
jgi:hypothetical protein